ncbi:MAG: CHASE domain-containing protein [Oligoflexia bacterium]|nr:CHASE domain-containing protein [Oligoflexia bacterium]
MNSTTFVMAIFNRKNWHFEWVVLVIALIITAVVALHIKESIDRHLEKEFKLGCEEIRAMISKRLNDYARILLGGAALFAASENVTRKKWKIFTQYQRIEKELPGIQGIGFSPLILHTELARHLQQVRREGFPAYKVRPEGKRSVYAPVVYLEPLTDRNLRAFGYDVLSEPVRRLAMERARDSGMAILTSKVILVQEIGADIQAGILMYVPIYRKEMPLNSIEERRAAIYGWVSAPYRMNDLIEGILSYYNIEKKREISIEIFDGEQVVAANLLYSWLPLPKKQANRLGHTVFTTALPIKFNGHRWTIRFEQTKAWVLAVEYEKVWFVVLGSTLITLLLFALVRALRNTHNEARRIANRLTSDLLKSELRWQFALEGPGDGLWDWNIETERVFFSKQWKKMLGYNENEIGDALEEWGKRIHADDRKKYYEVIHQHFQGETPFYSLECRMICKEGSIIWVLARGKVIEWSPEKKPLRMISVHTNISERKEGEFVVRELMEKSQRNDKLESLGVLAGGIAHDFNNLLSGIFGYIEIASSICDTHSEHNGRSIQEHLKKALGLFERAKKLTGQFLTFAKGGQPNKTTGCLSPLLKDCADFVLAGSNVSYRFHIAEDLWLCDFDEDQMNQAFSNIILNAKQFMPQGGHLVITAKNIALPLGEQVQISFADEGPGIAHHLLSRVFDPFYTTKKAGHGLGLAIAYSIVKKHNGEITVESNQGRGTTFHIFLPVSNVLE